VVFEVKEERYYSGTVGLFVSDFGLAPDTDVSFDDFVVSEY